PLSRGRHPSGAGGVSPVHGPPGGTRTGILPVGLASFKPACGGRALGAQNGRGRVEQGGVRPRPRGANRGSGACAVRGGSPAPALQRARVSWIIATARLRS